MSNVEHWFSTGNTPASGPLENKVLTNINLDIAEGEFVAFVGPSGCGKTTLLNMVAGLVEPETGSVTVDGAAPRLGDERVGYMLARDALLPWRTVRQNVTLPLEVRGVRPGEAAERATRELVKVGLADFVGSYPSRLSHGMRQRVALARTMVSAPSIMLMDEPFSALDAQTKLTLQDQFLQVWQGTGTTVIMVTHDLGEAIVMADRVIVFSGRPGAILSDTRVPLERPRHAMDLQASDEYHALFKDIWQVLRSGMEVAGV